MRYTLRTLSACAISCLFYGVSPSLAQQVPSPTNLQLEIETETGARCRVFSGGPTLNVSGGNQPLTYFNVGQDTPQDFYGMVSLSVPIGGNSAKSQEFCHKMADLEIKKKKMDIYLELFERGVLSKEEVDNIREELFPSPVVRKEPKQRKISADGKYPQVIVSYNN